MNMSDNKNLYYKLIALLSVFITDLRKNIAIFLVAILLPVAILFVLKFRKSNTYNASFTVVYEDLVRKIYGDRLEKLNTLLQNNKPKAAQFLGLDKKAIDCIDEIKGTNILGEDLSKDMNIDKIPFIVNITVRDTNYILDIQKGILNFLENSNNYLIEKRNLKIKEIADEITFINKQLGMMDTLKRKYNNGQVAGTLSPDKTNNTQADVYGLSYDLFKKRQELTKKLEMPMNLYVIDDAIVPVSAGRSVKFILMASLLFGFVLYLGTVYLLLPAIRYKKP